MRWTRRASAVAAARDAVPCELVNGGLLHGIGGAIGTRCAAAGGSGNTSARGVIEMDAFEKSACHSPKRPGDPALDERRECHEAEGEGRHAEPHRAVEAHCVETLVKEGEGAAHIEYGGDCDGGEEEAHAPSEARTSGGAPVGELGDDERVGGVDNLGGCEVRRGAVRRGGVRCDEERRGGHDKLRKQSRGQQHSCGQQSCGPQSRGPQSWSARCAPVMTAEICQVLHAGQSSESMSGWKKTET